jgi:hypothetical protein
MTRAANPHTAEGPDKISVAPHSGIWRVALNGAFYGDYVRRYWAIEAAFEKADDIAARGGGALITLAIDGQQDALLYDTRRHARAHRARQPPARRGRPEAGPDNSGRVPLFMLQKGQ